VNISVIGAGAWGTAIAIALARQNRHSVSLWAFEREVCESIAKRGVNEMFLPGEQLPLGIHTTNVLEEALRGAEIVVSVMPSHHTRRVFHGMMPFLREDMLFVSATKGVENETLLRMSEVVREVISELGWNPRIGALSGPSFAKEVAKGDPTAISIGSKDPELASLVQREFSDHTFRIYTNDDIVGVELGGALKNVIAIAAGVCDGLGLGHNTIAALITRGLAEIARLAEACGARHETMSGLAGMGDLVLTCTGGLSRNRTVGVELGKGRKLDEIIAGMHGMVAEGVLTTNAAVGLAAMKEVEMPITEQMYEILHNGKSPKESMRELMTRRGTSEVKLLTADQ
jgi:glycerol-3-phosphate dehydrogenase (NAD(P)+)